MGLGENLQVRRLKKAADVDGLICLMVDPGQSPPARRRAAAALGNLHAAAAVDALIVTLSDVEVRAIAALALGKIGDLRAAGPVSRLVQSEHGVVRRCAWKALSELKRTNPEQLLTALNSYNSEKAAGARRLVQRGSTPVCEWDDCPMCLKPLTKRLQHAAYCATCSHYFTDDNYAPRVSHQPGAHGALLGCEDAGPWLAPRRESLGYPEGSARAVAWRLYPSDSRWSPEPALAPDIEVMRAASMFQGD
jgi:ribosomal protein L37AE/L43A